MAIIKYLDDELLTYTFLFLKLQQWNSDLVYNLTDICH